MSDRTLVVIIGPKTVGTITQDERGELRFSYDPAYRADEASHPLSLSMPLAASDHDDSVVSAFLWGLLPDNEIVLERWARRFHVSARNPFALLSHVGEECAGAAQFVRPERVDSLLTEPDPPVEWFDDAALAERLRVLCHDSSAGRRPSDRGQFSLAGAQPKTALLRNDGRWGVPSGKMPTTHILKPATGEYAGHVENEHFCLALARRLGLRAARSTVGHFEDQVAIIVERYDRVVSSGGARYSVQRVHQEDSCQALGVSPARKYQHEGGPTPANLTQLIRDHSDQPSADIGVVVDALALNWLIAGTDAHAKNYSLLHAPGPRVRLAPLYGIASYLLYDSDPQRTRLAMKIGGEYRLRDIHRRQWEKLAIELGVDEATTLARVQELAAQIVEVAPGVAERIALDHPIIEQLAVALPERAQSCVRGW